MVRKTIFKSVIFVTLLSFAIACCSFLFRVDSPISKAEVQGFYAEAKNTLDAVYIGPSSVYSYWQAPIAWKEYGVAVLDYSTSAQPRTAYKYIINESLKTQDPDLLIIEVRPFTNDEYIGPMRVHNLIDYMPFSFNKAALTMSLCDELNLGLTDRMEFIFPFIRFHSQWKTLNMSNFVNEPSSVKNGVTGPLFINSSKGTDEMLIFTEQTSLLSDSSQASLEDLLDYCDTLDNIDVLFVSSPFLESEDKKMKLNTIEDILTSRGYDYISFNDISAFESMGIIADEDFQDSNHMNVIGSIKYTKYFGNLLKERYNLSDKRGNSEYASWDASFVTYTNSILSQTTIISNYLSYLNDDRYTVFFAVNEEASRSLNQRILQRLSDLGLKQTLEEMYGYSYIAVIEEGKVIDEEIGDVQLTASGQLSDGLKYSISSAGADSGSLCSIILDGTECAVNSRGLNIVVYDNELNSVVDKVCFDTYSKNMKATR